MLREALWNLLAFAPLRAIKDCLSGTPLAVAFAGARGHGNFGRVGLFLAVSPDIHGPVWLHMATQPSSSSWPTSNLGHWWQHQQFGREYYARGKGVAIGSPLRSMAQPTFPKISHLSNFFSPSHASTGYSWMQENSFDWLGHRYHCVFGSIKPFCQRGPTPVTPAAPVLKVHMYIYTMLLSIDTFVCLPRNRFFIDHLLVFSRIASVFHAVCFAFPFWVFLVPFCPSCLFLYLVSSFFLFIIVWISFLFFLCWCCFCSLFSYAI